MLLSYTPTPAHIVAPRAPLRHVTMNVDAASPKNVMLSTMVAAMLAMTPNMNMANAVDFVAPTTMPSTMMLAASGQVTGAAASQKRAAEEAAKRKAIQDEQIKSFISN